ncbi:leucine-rich repeat domain-containing protein [Myxococcus sp. K15C18031901]|uniref:leucine-rich repeat domain-containing protein n=1 Tax=Myxococcus dinghuensis TaxID=2906761 RepID=UPI0020A7327D|nr:leucine-rich repeat domain-containing protein [Myxococcus dinghuensis]MCP3100544.1 leucine-rich repeat domain-containing protein [Myxococcus dinghuensis]
MAKKPVSLVTSWKRVEKQVVQVLGKGAAGRRLADLEPRVVPFTAGFDPAPLLPPEYVELVTALGYRWLSTTASTLCLLPPRWRLGVSQQVGVPDRDWRDVRAEREAGTHAYGFVMFAAHDIEDLHGFAFGKSADGEALVVWEVEDSLPVSELGPFSTWLSETLAEVSAALEGVEEGDSPVEPPDLEGASLPINAKGKDPAAVFDAFPRDSKELLFNGRKLGSLPALIGEFTQLESLWVRTTGIQRVPPELGRCAKLRQLDLSFNPELTELPPELGDLASLDSINLNRTGLTTLPDSFEKLRNLTSVDLQSTPLKTVPPVLFRMPWLRALDLYWTTLPPEELDRLRSALPGCKVGVS